jgi:hypothetical protein
MFTFIKHCIHVSNRSTMTKKTMKMCSTSLAIKEVLIKTILRFHLTQVRMAIFKGKKNNKCWQGCGKTGALIHCLQKHKLK